MKNISHVASIIAKKRGVDVEIVEMVLTSFFKNVEATMNTAEFPYVRLEHVGLFLMKPRLINTQVTRIIMMLRQLPKSHWSKQTNQKVISALRVKLRQLLIRRNEVATTIYNYRLQKQRRDNQGMV